MLWNCLLYKHTKFQKIGSIIKNLEIFAEDLFALARNAMVSVIVSIYGNVTVTYIATLVTF